MLDTSMSLLRASACDKSEFLYVPVVHKIDEADLEATCFVGISGSQCLTPIGSSQPETVRYTVAWLPK